MEAVSPPGLGGNDGDVLPPHLAQASHDTGQQPPAAHRQQDGVRFGLQRVLQLLDQAGVTLPAEVEARSRVPAWGTRTSLDLGNGDRNAGAEPWQHSPHQGVVEGVNDDPALGLCQLQGSPVGIIPHLAGAMGAQQDRARPPCPRGGSLITMGLGVPETHTGRWAELGVPGVTLPQCWCVGGAGGGTFQDGVCHAHPCHGRAEVQPPLILPPRAQF